MACPYFYPVARLETNGWEIPPRLPLGDPFQGECRAADPAVAPDESRQRQTCNLGYGRGCCDRFPESAEADAVRFHVSKHRGKLIRIQYVFEKDCWPGEHGEFECSKTGITSGPPGEILRRQAAAFLESYLRRS